MFTREKKLIALLLSAALALTMNTGIFAAVGAEQTAAAAANTTTVTSSVQTTTVQTAKLTNKKGQEFYVTMSFNETPLFTGKKIDPVVLNAKVTISYDKFVPKKGESAISGNIANLSVTKVKFEKGYKGSFKGSVAAVGEVGFYPSALDVKAAGLEKLDKKIVKAALKALKPAKDATFPFKLKIQKFSTSMNDVAVTTATKKADVNDVFDKTTSANYVLSVSIKTKKGVEIVKAATIYVRKYNKKGNLKPLKIKVAKGKKSSPNFKYENGVFEFLNKDYFDLDAKVEVKNGTASKKTASGNAVSGNTVSAN